MRLAGAWLRVVQGRRCSLAPLANLTEVPGGEGEEEGGAQSLNRLGQVCRTRAVPNCC